MASKAAPRGGSVHDGIRAARAIDDAAIDAAIAEHCDGLAAGKSVSPNDVARALLPGHWQKLLPRVREASLRLAAAGELELLRKGRPVPPEAARGVIRLRRPG